jgi:hypothetical protein
MGTSQGNTPNALAVTQMIANETLAQLMNNTVMLPRVNRKYDDQFGKKGMKIGDTVQVRLPVQFQGRRGPNAQIEGLAAPLRNVTISTQYGVDYEWSSYEDLLSLDFIQDRYAKPAATTIGNAIDSDLLSLVTQFPYEVGTPGTPASSIATFLAARTQLDKNATPVDDKRYITIDSDTEAAVIAANATLFNSPQQISSQYVKGRMGTAQGFDWYMDQNVANFTVGPLGGSPTVNGGNQTGSSLVTHGWTAAAALRLNAGDVFTIANVFQVNPVNNATGAKKNYKNLQQFVVTAAVSSDGSGNATIPIYPAITVTGAYQTVSASPADAAAITVLGAANTVTPQGFAFHRDAITFVNVDLPTITEGATCAFARDPQTGLSLRVCKQWNVMTDITVTRFDLLGGCNVLRPEFGVRIAS